MVEYLCRICLSDENVTVSLDSEVEILHGNKEKIHLNASSDGHFTLLDIIQYVTGSGEKQSKENDRYPKKICSECLNLLLNAYNFHKCYLNATQYLEKSVFRKTTIFDDHDYSTLDSNNKEERHESIVKTEPILDIVEVNVDVDDYECAAVQKHPCPICLQAFTALELRQHAGTHKGLKSYFNNAVPIKQECNFIPETSKYEKANGKRQKYECPHCNEEFKCNDFREHISTHKINVDDNKLLQCRFCPRVFKMLGHLKMHENCHRKEYPYNCAACGKKFVQKSNYDCHLLSHDPNAEPEHKCSICQSAFYNRIHLNRHMVMHRENRSYNEKFAGRKCPDCLMSFTKNNFEGHQCVKVAQRKSKTTTTKNMVNKVNKKAKRKMKKQRSRSLCSICGQQVLDMRLHMIVHSDVRPYECHSCGKGFRYKVLLKRHELIHTGQKPFICSWCGKGFNTRANMQTHERIHIGNKCHVCDVCGKGFLEKAYLRKHRLIHDKSTK